MGQLFVAVGIPLNVGEIIIFFSQTQNFIFTGIDITFQQGRTQMLSLQIQLK